MKRSLVLLALLLAAVGSAGAWNYHQNLAAERAEFRPYRGYTEEDLAALAEAYRQEVEQLTDRYEAARGVRADVSGGGLLDEQVRKFERAQQAGSRVREIGSRLSVREADLREIQEEQRRRVAERDQVRLFLRRLLTLR